jgi:hypothetical protein
LHEKLPQNVSKSNSNLPRLVQFSSFVKGSLKLSLIGLLWREKAILVVAEMHVVAIIEAVENPSMGEMERMCQLEKDLDGSHSEGVIPYQLFHFGEMHCFNFN